MADPCNASFWIGVWIAVFLMIVIAAMILMGL
jgi:hypothetical protein